MVNTSGFTMTVLHPLPDETPLAFVERADALKVPEEEINTVLKQHFGFGDDGEMKELKLQSKVFWDMFYREHAQGIFQRAGTRYAAVKFVEKKSANADQRRKLSAAEIDALVDSFGEWQR